MNAVGIGILYLVLGNMVAVFSDALVKVLEPDQPIFQFVFFRQLSAALLLAPLAAAPAAAGEDAPDGGAGDVLPEQHRASLDPIPVSPYQIGRCSNQPQGYSKRACHQRPAGLGMSKKIKPAHLASLPPRNRHAARHLAAASAPRNSRSITEPGSAAIK